MTVTILPRERGATIRCDCHGCPHALTTGQILVKAIRAYARSMHWIRGLDPGTGSPDTGGRPSNRSWDICPTHAVEEREKCDARRRAGSAMRKRRDELRAMTGAQRLEERKRMRKAARERRRAVLKQAAA